MQEADELPRLDWSVLRIIRLGRAAVLELRAFPSSRTYRDEGAGPASMVTVFGMANSRLFF